MLTIGVLSSQNRERNDHHQSVRDELPLASSVVHMVEVESKGVISTGRGD